MKIIKVIVHTTTQSQPMEFDNVINSYEKGSFYCVYLNNNLVYKFPIVSIFRVIEEYI